MRKNYATDVSDSEWNYLQDQLSELPKKVKTRTHSLRDIFYVLKTGCHWRLLPHDFPPWRTVFYHFRRFRLSGMWHRIFTILRAAERKRAGKDPNPSAAIMDSQSIKTTEECRKLKPGVYDAHSNGYDAHKHIKGRKRHLLVDTLGLPLSVYVSPADIHDKVGARWLLAGLKPLLPRLKKVWADGTYSGDPLFPWCRKEGDWELEVVECDREACGFEVIPKRWIIERTISWIGRNLRMSKDYERKVQTSETFIEVAMIRLILKRLAREA